LYRVVMEGLDFDGCFSSEVNLEKFLVKSRHYTRDRRTGSLRVAETPSVICLKSLNLQAINYVTGRRLSSHI
jgi:hypothetical protein